MFRIWNYAENCNLVEGQSSSEANFAKIKVNPRLLENSKIIGKTFNLIRYIFWSWPWKCGSCLKLANLEVLTKGGCVSLPVNQNLWIKNSISGQILGYRQYFWPFLPDIGICMANDIQIIWLWKWFRQAILHYWLIVYHQWSCPFHCLLGIGSINTGAQWYQFHSVANLKAIVLSRDKDRR